jgi:dimethylhistidine N-methyltransferase
MKMSSQASYQFYEQTSEIEDVHAQLIGGFRQTPKSISPKFFYDERGSELFTAITRTTEYYPTRTEMGLLESHGKAMADCIGPNATLIEYGSGSSEKIRLLLETLRPQTYVPMDISKDYLATSANTIAKDYPWLEVLANCVDYSQDFDLPVTFDGNVAAFFPGSSIGNFSPDSALSFLKRVRRHVGVNGGLLIGVDLKKDIDVLNHAYNDSAGITADFNLNVLNHINEVYRGNFDLTKFRHRAAYNESLGCIQMFITSLCDQTVNVAGESFELIQGEEIHTENSFKYSETEFRDMCRQAGFTRDRFWVDGQEWFGVFYVS